MIVVCKTHACLLGGFGDMPPPPPPQENFEFIYIPLRLLLTQSGTKFLIILMTHTTFNFRVGKIVAGGGGGGGGSPGPPCMKPCT